MKQVTGTLIVGVVALTLSAGVAYPQVSLEAGVKTGLSMTSISNERTGLVQSVRALSDEISDHRDDFAAKGESGLVFGGFLVLNIGEVFALQPELLFSKKRAKVTGTAQQTLDFGDIRVDADWTLSEEIELSYIEIPLLAKLKIPGGNHVKPSLFAGPVFALVRSGYDDIDLSLRLSGEGPESITSVRGETKISNMKDSDFGWVIGGELRFDVSFGKLVVDIRYCTGTGDLFEDVNPDDIPYLDDDTVPKEYPMANFETGKASDFKPRALSLMVGLSFPIGR